LAQAKAGLIEAAKAGLIDGSELTESWFLSLKRDIYLIRKKSQKAKKDKSSSSTNENTRKKKEEDKKEKPTKKISPVITGLIKFVKAYQINLNVRDEVVKALEQIKSVEELGKSFKTGEQTHLAQICYRYAKNNLHVISDDDQIDLEALAQFTAGEWDRLEFDEHEKKSTRTWFPRFFTVKVSHPNGGPDSSGVLPEKPADKSAGPAGKPEK
jgi:hypothetical protein